MKRVKNFKVKVPVLNRAQMEKQQEIINILYVLLNAMDTKLDLCKRNIICTARIKIGKITGDLKRLIGDASFVLGEDMTDHFDSDASELLDLVDASIKASQMGKSEEFMNHVEQFFKNK